MRIFHSSTNDLRTQTLNPSQQSLFVLFSVLYQFIFIQRSQFSIAINGILTKTLF